MTYSIITVMAGLSQLKETPFIAKSLSIWGSYIEKLSSWRESDKLPLKYLGEFFDPLSLIRTSADLFTMYTLQMSGTYGNFEYLMMSSAAFVRILTSYTYMRVRGEEYAPSYKTHSDEFWTELLARSAPELVVLIPFLTSNYINIQALLALKFGIQMTSDVFSLQVAINDANHTKKLSADLESAQADLRRILEMADNGEKVAEYLLFILKGMKDKSFNMDNLQVLAELKEEEEKDGKEENE